jgi:hypothetical protein
MHRVLVPGGYGFFDTRICATLATESAIELYVAGRYDTKAAELAAKLNLPADRGASLMRIQANSCGNTKACRFPMRITIKPAFGSG